MKWAWESLRLFIDRSWARISILYIYNTYICVYMYMCVCTYAYTFIGNALLTRPLLPTISFFCCVKSMSLYLIWGFSAVRPAAAARGWRQVA